MERADLEQWKAREVARLLALVETERRYYQEIVASLPVGLLVLSSDLTVISSNRALRSILGLPAGALRGRLDKLLPGWVLDQVEQVLKSGQPQNNLLVTEPKSGRRLRINILAMRGWDDESGPEALLAIEDLSGAERTGAASLPALGVPVPAGSPLASSELLDQLNAVVWMLDLASTSFLFVSGPAARLLGYPAEHWTGNPSFWTSRVHPADRDWVTQSYRRAIQRGDAYSCEFRALAAGGHVLWLRESVRVIPDAEGRPSHLVGVTLDVTERRMLEEQLVQSERVQAVSQLSGRLAHDLNNMLMIVIGHSEELLNNLPASSPLRADVQEIVNASERISGLTAQLLAFTRRPGPQAGAVDLEAVLRAFQQHRAGRPRAQAGVEVKLSARPNLAKADAERLEQLLESLIERQGQAMIEASRVQIKEDLRVPAAPLRFGTYAVISITLRGQAMEENAKNRWFESVLAGKDAADEQASAVTRAYATVRQWGGDIVLSVTNEGTVLRIFLEAVPETAPYKPGIEGEPAAPAGPATPLPTILVAEDEPGIRALLVKILRRQGYDVLEADGGEKALALANRHKGAIDLLISDVLMPGMRGPELVERLRKQGREMKVLYVSGYTGEAGISPANLPPGTAFLEKPFTLGSLLDRVREVLSSR